MSKHLFILQTGLWYGEGKIQLNMIEEELLFQTTWNVLEKKEDGSIVSVQTIQIDGLSEEMKNELTFSNFSPTHFSVLMSNQNVEKISGKGIIDEQTIAWEFKDEKTHFQGFEIYHSEEGGGYKMHAEYVTSDQFRTKITGRIWQKNPTDPLEIKKQKEEEEKE